MKAFRQIECFPLCIPILARLWGPLSPNVPNTETARIATYVIKYLCIKLNSNLLNPRIALCSLCISLLHSTERTCKSECRLRDPSSGRGCVNMQPTPTFKSHAPLYVQSLSDIVTTLRTRQNSHKI